MMQASGPAELVIDAVLETAGPQAPAPGHSHWLSVCRYRVLKLLKGAYPHPLILVAHDAADMSSAAFLSGTRKELEVSASFPAHVSLLNPFSDKGTGTPVFYCVGERVVEFASGQ